LIFEDGRLIFFILGIDGSERHRTVLDRAQGEKGAQWKVRQALEERGASLYAGMTPAQFR